MGALASMPAALKKLRGKRVYFDTAPIIYALEDAPVFAAPCITLLRASEERQLIGFTGAAALAEILVKPLRSNNREYAEQLKTLFLSGDIFQCVEHSMDIFLLAASIRAERNYKPMDALHLATSIILGCSFFVTNDEAIRSSTALEVVLIKDFV